MNAQLAQNVRIFREVKHWTQQHLADAADVLLRTVQRVEKGDGASVETLSALAAAFDTTIDLLQTDFTVVAAKVQEEAAALERRKLEKTHDIISLTPVTCSADLEVVGGVHGYVMDCAATDDRAQDTFASLRGELFELGEVWEEAGSEDRRRWVRAAYESVVRLNELGLVVCVGRGRRVVPTRTGPLRLTTFCLVAWPKGQEKHYVAIDKSA